jgi:hypothetical protein
LATSPELVQDTTRDFSVYVLDPLELIASPAPIDVPRSSAASQPTPNQTGSRPRGVAVGLGLMSWALNADESDSTPVTGTLIEAGAMTQLEVVFLLREARHYPIPGLSQY